MISKRRADGKETTVLANGNRIPNNKLKKETSRYALSAARVESGGLFPQMPNIIIRTPSPEPSSILPTSTSKFIPSTFVSIDNLPWIIFVDLVGKRQWATSTTNAPDSTHEFWVNYNITSKSGQQAASAGMSREAEALNMQASGLSKHALLLFCASLSTETSGQLEIDINTLSTYWKAAIIEREPEKQTSTMNMINSSQKSDVLLGFLELVVFMSSNNLIGADQTYEAVKLIALSGGYEIVASVITVSSLTVEVFAERLFFEALKREDVVLLQIAVEGGADPNSYIPKENMTPLRWSALKDNISMFRVLLKAGADLNLSDNIVPAKDSQEAERSASICGSNKTGKLVLDDQVVKRGDILLSRDAVTPGSEFDTPRSGRSPEPYNTELVCEVCGSPRLQGNALQAAAQTGSFEGVKFLLEAGADPRVSAGRCTGRTALQAAVESENMEIITLLLQSGADLNAPAAYHLGKTALQAAVFATNMKIVINMIEAGADVNGPPSFYNGRTALQAAAEAGAFDICRLLLDRGADVNATAAPHSGKTALQAASGGGHLEIVRMLLEFNADVNGAAASYSGRTALQAAAEKGNIQIVELLIHHGANVNAQPSTPGKTALEAAAGSGRLSIVLLLLQTGAEVQNPPLSTPRKTALQAAVECGSLDIVQALVSAGATISPRYDLSSGRNLLQIAASYGRVGIAYVLLNAYTSYKEHWFTKWWSVAIEEAAKLGRIDMVQLLCNVGASLQDDTVSTFKAALWQSRMNNHKAVSKILRQYLELTVTK